MAKYTKTAWKDGAAPSINAANLNKIEEGIAGAVQYEITTDFDLATERGLYTTSGTTTNAPASGNYWALVVLPTTLNSTSYVQQIAIKESTNDMYTRYRSGSTWSKWVRIWNEKNLVVSQTTPAVIEGTVWIKF